MTRLLGLCVLGATLWACDVGAVEDDADDAQLDALAKPDFMRRVVITRLYQKRDFTLPQAGATVTEKVAYVCGVLGRLHPTYVSGTIRLDDDSELTADQIAVFTGVRDCLPNAKFDIVLNAEHYTMPGKYPNDDAGAAALKHRADVIVQQLDPDIIFFDFFNSPYNKEHVDAGWHYKALTRGTVYILDTLHKKVGGNVWGMEPPPNASFIALDNFDRPNNDGWIFDQQQIATFKKLHIPTLLHIENNPQNKGSHGLQWIDNGPEYRRAQLDKYASAQKQLGFTYMYPVLFPLQCCSATGTCGPDHCNDAGSTRPAYDASRDANLLDTMSHDLDHY